MDPNIGAYIDIEAKINIGANISAWIQTQVHGYRLRGIEANKLLQENQNSHIDPLTF